MSQSNAVESLFKRAEGRWIFRAPNPWMYGDAQHYLVTDKQKQELSELLTPEPPAQILLGLGLVWAILTWVFAALGMASWLGFKVDFKVETATLFDLVVIMMVLLAPVLAI